jgi:hypothetical protein
VNGAKVRAVDPDGIGGWHHAVYPKLVPKNEIWIEKLAGGAKEERFILAHEMIEIALMRIRGWKYQRAHDVANRFERKLRAGEKPREVFTAAMRIHLPRRHRADTGVVGHNMAVAYEDYK